MNVGIARDALFRLRRAKPPNYSARIKSWRTILKPPVGFVGSIVLAVVLFFAFTILRKSVPYVLRSDLEQLAASGPYNNEKLASAICGKPVDLLGSAETSSPVLASPRARLRSWKLFIPPSAACRRASSALACGARIGAMPGAITPPSQASVRQLSPSNIAVRGRIMGGPLFWRPNSWKVRPSSRGRKVVTPRNEHS